MRFKVLLIAMLLAITIVIGSTVRSNPALAANMTVNSLADGDLTTLNGNGTCDLREAITNANSNDQSGSSECPAGSGADEITFSVTGTIELDGGELPRITADLTITGNGITLDANGENRHLSIEGDPNAFFNTDVTLTGLTFANGAVHNNESNDDNGGAIHNQGANLTIIASTFVGNTAVGGGALYNSNGEVIVANSTFSGNTAESLNGRGGAILNRGVQTMTLVNTTIADNTAYNGGAGIFNLGGTVSTTNVIVADSSGATNCDAAGLVIWLGTDGTNLSDDASCSSYFIQGDAQLTPLGDFGGPTQTHVPLPGSDAIDAGDADACAAEPVNELDQRGVTRPQGAGCDIGAVERQAGDPLFVPSDVVTTVVDAGDYTDGCTLRDAITANLTDGPAGACIPASDDIIRFADPLDGDTTSTRTIILNGEGFPAITGTISIDGGGTVTLDADNTGDGVGESYHFWIFEGGDLTLTGLTIVNGRDPVGGYGTIMNNGGSVTIASSTLSDNDGTWGAAVDNWTGTVDITDSTFSGNDATWGGAVRNTFGSITITRSILSGNTASSDGGAIHNSDVMTITDSVISGNVVDIGYGGALFNTSGSMMTITNSTLDGNRTDRGNGGAVANMGTITVINSTISNNTAADTDSSGGAFINNFGGVLKISNSTISGNSAGEHGGALYNSSDSGNSRTEIRNSTISGNASAQGGTIYNNFGTVAVANVLLANSISDINCVTDGGAWDGVEDSNLSDDGSCPTPLFFEGEDDLEDLADNGGTTLLPDNTYTRTHLPGPGSDAIDRGDNTVCASALVNNLDQRGLNRPINSYGLPEATCDIGAVEVQQIYLPDLTVAKAGPATTTPGGTVQYTITVTNSGDGPALDVTAEDTLPTGLAFDAASSSDGCTAVGQQVTCAGTDPLPHIDGSNTIEFTIATTVPTSALDGDTYTNTASVAALNTELDDTNNTSNEVTTLVQAADLAITKRAGAREAAQGDTLIYTLDVENRGSLDAANAVVTDTLPDGVTFDWASSGCTASGQTVTCALGTLSGNGGSGNATIAVIVSGDVAVVPDATVLTNEASVTSGTPESSATLGDNTDSVSTTIWTPQDLAIEKVVRTMAARPGDTVRYDLTVTNTAPDGEANHVVLVDELPDDTSFVSVQHPAGWVCDEAPNHRLICTIEAMAPGSEAFFVVRVQLADDVRGRITNEASVSSDDRDPDTTNNEDTVRFTVLTGPPVPQPDITPPPTEEPTGTATATPSPTAEPTETPTATPTEEPGTYTYDLSFRWTLITWYGVDGISPAEALGGDDDIVAIVTALFGWDGSGQSWLGYFPNAVDIPGANDLMSLQYGQAYWIAIDNPDGATWTIVVDDLFEE